MPAKGADLLLKVNTGTTETPVWTTVGGQKNASLDRSRNSIDVSDKSSDWDKVLNGRKNWKIDCDGNWEEEDNGNAKLEDAYDNDEKILVIFSTPTGNAYKGFAIIENLKLDAPENDATKISISLKGDDILEKITL